MTTNIHALPSLRPEAPAAQAPSDAYRTPNYDCREIPDEMRLVVYVPGVSASGVEIEAAGSDLLITAHKDRFVRVNWQALNLEGSQRDYQLRLRLGLGFDYSAMRAAIHDGVLTVIVPKRSGAEADPAGLRRVA